MLNINNIRFIIMQRTVIKHFTEKSVKIFNQNKITIYHCRKYRIIVPSKYQKIISWATKKEDRKQRDSWLT